MKRLFFFLLALPIIGFSQTVSMDESFLLKDRPWLFALYPDEVLPTDKFPEGVVEVTHRKSEALHLELSVYPTITEDQLVIVRPSDKVAHFQILSGDGKVVRDGVLSSSCEEIKVDMLPSDSYTLEVKEGIGKYDVAVKIIGD